MPATLVTVTGRYRTLTGAPAKGSVIFTPSTTLVDRAANEIITPNSYGAELDANGAFSVRIPATDDPAIDPIGFTYTVTEQITGIKSRDYSIQVPIASPSLDLADVLIVQGSTGISPAIYVDLTTAQTIGGAKTFTSTVTMGAGASLRADYFQDRASTKGYLDTQTTGVDFLLTNRVPGNVPFVARGAANQTADLQQWQNSAGTVLSNIASSGAMTLGAIGGQGSLTLNGVYNGVNTTLVITAGGSNPVITGSTGNNQLLITQPSGVILGRSTSDVNAWDLATSSAGVGVGNTSPAAQLHATSRAATRVALIARGAGSQTADLQQWQAAAGNVLASINSIGSPTFPYTYITAPGNALALQVRGSAGHTADLQQWQNSAGTALARITSAGRIEGAGVWGDTIEVGGAGNLGSHINAIITNAANRGLVIRGAASQTGDLVRLQSSNGAALYGITAAGLPAWQASGNQQLTVGPAGTAAALPAAPTNYLKVVDSGGNTLVVPAYAAA